MPTAAPLARSRSAWLAVVLAIARLGAVAAEPLAESVDSGNTALHLAALRGDAERVETLLATGADPNAVNRRRGAPLHYGVGSERVVRALLKAGVRVDVVSEDGMTPLMSAVMRGTSFAVAKLLVDAGADVNAARPDDKVSTLAQAIYGGDLRTIQLLLERGADPNAKGEITPPAQATYCGRLEVVRMLLNRGVDVNTPDPFFGSCLNLACYSGHTAIAALFIERGAKLDTPSVFGQGTPPMVWSAYHEQDDTTLARLMISHGADVDAANAAGDTALSYALKRGAETRLVRYLREAGAKPQTPFREKTVPDRDVPPAGAAREKLARDSAARAIALLQSSSKVFLETGLVRNEQKCVSCHHQNLPAVAYGLARERGLRVDEHEVGRQLHAQIASWSKKPEAARQMRDPTPNPPIVLGYGLEGLAALHYPADEITSAITHYLLGAQQPNGSWVSFDIRPPMEAGPLLGTAWAIRSLQLFPPAGEETAARDAVRRGAEWLAAQEAGTHNELVFQLFGLTWAGAPASQLQPYIERLGQQQRGDGGWAGLPGRESDAYATGSTLVALQQAGVKVTAPSYQQGIEFLLRTQFADGSWWVRTRTWPLQPHFDSHFPHGKDQWISAGGTAWATIALLLTLEPNVRPDSLPTAKMIIASYSAKVGPALQAGLNSDLPNTANAQTHAGAEIRPQLSFARDIWPLLDRSCTKCHGGEEPRGKYSLANRESLLKGGQSGDPAVIPGRSGESRLLAYVADQVEDLEMPPLNRREKYPALTPREIELLRTWIEAGAEWDKSP